jgi:hypothetical protein
MLEEGEGYSVEDPAFDFAEIVKEAAKGNGQVQKKEEPKKKVSVRQKKKKAAEGGC